MSNEASKQSNTALEEVKALLQQKKFGALFKGATDNTLIQFFRYVFVGGFATVFDWGISSLLFLLVFGGEIGAMTDAMPWLTYSMFSNGMGFVAGLIVNYVFSTFFVFQNAEVDNRLIDFLKFSAIGVVGLLMTLGITWVFELMLGDVTSWFQIIGKVISTGVAFFWNFFARKYLLYSNPKKDA